MTNNDQAALMNFRRLLAKRSLSSRPAPYFTILSALFWVQS
jgi:hypothetical protein